VPEIPHDQYPPYPPPPFTPTPTSNGGPSSSQPNLGGRGRANTLEVDDRDRRGRRATRRSVSPGLGVYNEEEVRRSPTPHVRFSTEDEVLGERRRSPPPRYRA